MEFTDALKEANKLGMSAVVFSEMWNNAVKRETEEPARRRKRTVDKEIPLDDEKSDGSPNENDRRKRQGWIVCTAEDLKVDGDTTGTGKQESSSSGTLFSEMDKSAEQRGQISTNTGREKVDTQGASNQVDEKAPEHVFGEKPWESNFSTKVEKKLTTSKLTPPSYEQSHHCQKANVHAINNSQLTNCKMIHRNSDDEDEPSSDEDVEQTKCKVPVGQDKNESKSDKKIHPKEDPEQPWVYCDASSEGNIPIQFLEKTKLTETIVKLQQEQEMLQAKFLEHDVHLRSLLEKQPSLHQTLKRKTSVIRSKQAREESTHHMKTLSQVELSKTSSIRHSDDDHIYVQIEQLYTNFARMNFPFDDMDFPVDVALGKSQPNSKENAGDHTVLHQQNHELLQQIKSLEGNLRKRKPVIRNMKSKESQMDPKPRMDPKPHMVPKLHMDPKLQMDPKSSTYFAIQNIPLYCNVKENTLLNAATPGSQSPNMVSTVMENVITGCPMSPQPTIHDVKPTEIIFEWNISNYSDKFNAECCQERVKTVSSPFYISHHGYLAQFEAYLNGNGSGQGRCMSVFLRIIKGNYDNQLKWPVQMSFIVVLVNQSRERNHSLKGGSPALSNFEYLKPTGHFEEASDCWGLIEFVPHSLIYQREYIKSDRIKLEVRLKVL